MKNNATAASCARCNTGFTVGEAEADFLERMQVPVPGLCPTCRVQQRLMYRNERHLYRRTCDYTGKSIISIYAPESPYTVYNMKDWWGANWNPLQYGREIDWNRSLLLQIHELSIAVPKPALLSQQCENSEYVNNELGDKNCYMTFAGGFLQDCLYSRMLLSCKDCSDCLNCAKCELCYECVNVQEGYRCLWSRDCTNCSDLVACVDCVGCRDCIGCSGLRQKQHCIFNVQHSPAEYKKKLAELMGNPLRNLPFLLAQCEKLRLQSPVRAAVLVQCEGCTGDGLRNCSGCVDCYDLSDSQDCRYVCDGEGSKDCQDQTMTYNDELVYNGMGVVNGARNCVVGTYCWGCSDTHYSQFCFSSKNCFGCAGLNHREYCILNNQYTRSEYEALLPKLIQKMRADGQWGEFFPAELSPFGYNESMASEQFPLTEAEVTARGWRWRAETAGSAAATTLRWEDVPDAIADVPASITEEILACTHCTRQFRLVPQELRFYRNLGVPVPRRCFECRHLARLALRAPRRLWDRACAKCKKAIVTPYAPDRPETVYCEECFREAVY